MEPHLICVVTLGLCRCGFVSDTETSGGLVCPHCCHETAVTAKGGEGGLYRKLVKRLLQVGLQQCSLISNHPSSIACLFDFLRLPSPVALFPPTSREQGRALCQAAAHPTFPAQPLLQPVLESINKSSGPRRILLAPDSAPSSHRRAQSHLQVPPLKPVFLQKASSNGKEKSRGSL